MRAFPATILLLCACLSFAQGGQGGAVGTANDGQTQDFDMILTPGQSSELKVEAKADDVILAVVESGAFDPAVALVAPDGKKLVENDDIREGDQRSRVIFRFKADGTYKLTVSGFKGAAGGPFRISLKRFHAPLLEGGSASADFSGIDPVWRAIPIKKDTPTVIATYGSGNQVPSGYDSTGERLANEADAMTFGMGGRFTYTSPIDQEIYVFIPRSGYRGFTIDAVPVKFQELAVNGEVSGELARSQQMAYRFHAAAGALLRTQAGPGRSGFQVAFRPVKLDDPKSVNPFGSLPGISKNSNAGTYFVRASGVYEAIVAHTGFQPQAFRFSISEFSRAWQPETQSDSLPIGENLYYKFDLPLGVLLDLSSTSAVFDMNISLLDADGNAIANQDDNGDSPDPKFQMLVTRPGTYILRVGSYGNGGGGAFSIEKHLTFPSQYRSGETFELGADRPALRLIPAKKGQFFYLAVTGTSRAELAFYNPDGRILPASQMEEPGGRRIFLVNPQSDGDILVTFSTGAPGTVTVSNATIGG